MQKSEIKLGDRIYWPGNTRCEGEAGTVCYGYNESIFTESGYAGTAVWVKWDSDGSVLHVPINEINEIKVICDPQEEYKALELLRSLGYTCTKEI